MALAYLGAIVHQMNWRLSLSRLSEYINSTPGGKKVSFGPWTHHMNSRTVLQDSAIHIYSYNHDSYPYGGLCINAEYVLTLSDFYAKIF